MGNLVQFMIPTYNNVDDVDATFAGILEQHFPADAIFVIFVDFGSTDGTYEKLLDYGKERIGVYRILHGIPGRTMPSYAIQLRNEQPLGYPILLHPGDVLYPNFLETMIGVYERNQNNEHGIGIIAAEVDLFDGNGNVVSNRPVFDDSCLIRGRTGDVSAFFESGIFNNVVTFGGGYYNTVSTSSVQHNNRDWWIQLSTYAGVKDVIYINKPLACFKERRYEDEVDELAFLFARILSDYKWRTSNPDIIKNAAAVEEALMLGKTALSSFALWRSFISFGRDRKREAEDCLDMAKIMQPSVVKTEQWGKMRDLLGNENDEARNWLSRYFDGARITRTAFSNSFIR